MKYFSSFLLFALLVTVAPMRVQAAEGPEVSRAEPTQAFVDTPTTFWVTATDPDGVAGCEFLVSSQVVGDMTYNNELSRWEYVHTFDDSRTANSIAARCTDSNGNTENNKGRIISIEGIDRAFDGGDPGDVDLETPTEVDATAFSEAQVVAQSPVLIKTPCPGGEDATHPCRTVYFLDLNGIRHAFPNEATYFSWYEAFLDIHVITEEMMAGFTLGRNVRYHPGKRMVKFPTVNKVYAVGHRGVLRPIVSEAVARALYGDDWNQKIDDLSEVFFNNYTVGEEITDAGAFDRDSQINSVTSINDNLNQ